MILTADQILQLLKEPRSTQDKVFGVSLQDDHKFHITGEGYEKRVSKMKGWESENDFSIRKQIAKPATIEITSIVLDDLNRWITSQGTVKKVDFKDDKKNEEFQEVLSQVWQGKSFDEFIKSFYREGIYTEFNGFILVTKPRKVTDTLIEKEGIYSTIEKGKSLNPYLIFIAASEIHDYLLNGDKVEYLIISLPEDTFRVIDDEKDALYKYGKDKKSIIEISLVPNEIKYVPARKLSNINAKLLNNQVKTSPIHHLLPALDRYFSSDIDLRMQFIRHNYPKLAIVMVDCNHCHGEGDVYVGDEKQQCSKCKGFGKLIPIDRDGVMALPEYMDKEMEAYPGSPASYITPDVESLRLGKEDLKDQRINIIYSGTGDKNLMVESMQTATENMINSRSLEDRISEISGMVEEFEKYIKKAIKDMHNDFRNITDYSITVNYGKRISIKGESELSDEIKRAKENAMPMSYVQALQRDLIYSKYKNNESELQRQLLLSDLEPFAGYSIKELYDMGDIVNKRDMLLKINFDAVIDEYESEIIITEYKTALPYKKRMQAIKEELYAILQRRTGEGNQL